MGKVIQICPNLPMARDCLNRTPLHVAAGVGASLQVIKYLCLVYPDACEIQDEDGKTPLHCACDVDCKLFEEQLGRRELPTYEVIHTLLSASVAPASMEDKGEMSPLEYAIFSKADLKVVKLLQKAAQKLNWRAQQEECKLRSRRQLRTVVC